MTVTILSSTAHKAYIEFVGRCFAFAWLAIGQRGYTLGVLHSMEYLTARNKVRDPFCTIGIDGLLDVWRSKLLHNPAVS